MTTQRLDRLVDLQERVVTRDDYGGEAESWDEIATVWARVRQTGVREQYVNNADREQATRNALMRIRFREDVTEAEHRVLYDQHAWDILGIDEIGYRRFLDLTVQTELGGELQYASGFTVIGGLSDDDVPEAAELTVAFAGSRITFPAFTDKHVLIGRLATEADIVTVVFTDDASMDNQVAGFTEYATPVDLYSVWVSNQRLTFADERTLEVA